MLKDTYDGLGLDTLAQAVMHSGQESADVVADVARETAEIKALDRTMADSLIAKILGADSPVALTALERCKIGAALSFMETRGKTSNRILDIAGELDPDLFPHASGRVALSSEADDIPYDFLADATHGGPDAAV